MPTRSGGGQEFAGVVWLAGRIYADSAMRTGTRMRFLEAFRG